MLSFKRFQVANEERQLGFINKHGQTFAPYSGLELAGAAAGELGEMANLVKKVRRGDVSLDEAREAIGKEIADTVTYLSLLASYHGVDLESAVVQKFNEVSDRVNSSVKL
jgi:NTP pyrophosphatase (non-canonical NTP hydrolase)